MAHILLIDDDDALRQIVKAALGADGHSTVSARDGIEGVSHFRAGCFDLVMSDIFMPDQDGIQTISEIRETDPKVPIIVVSAGASYVSSTDILADAAALGANEVLCKPFSIAELRGVVSRLLAAAPAG